VGRLIGGFSFVVLLEAVKSNGHLLVFVPRDFPNCERCIGLVGLGA